MEAQGDEAVPQHPKPSKSTNPDHFSSILNQDLILPMPNLPVELITEILLKIPVESLLRFRSVSKSWLSLISSPEFVKAHLLSSVSNKDYTHHGLILRVDTGSGHGVKDCSLRALLYHPIKEVFDLDYPRRNPYNYIWFVGCVNGLICLAIFDGLYDLFIWNPSIKKYKKLPNFRSHVTRRSKDERIHSKFGFAYDELQDDYKVVGVITINRRGYLSRVEVKIYSLKRDSWRCINDFQGQELLDHSAPFVNGKLHWLDKQQNIICFDLTNEKWEEVEQPYFFRECGLLKLSVFESDLSVICNKSTNADVWVMKEYGVKESWTKIFTIKSPADNSMRMGPAFVPTILMSNESELLLHYGSHITKYNPKDDSVNHLECPCLEAAIYVKSLICPFSQQGP